MAPASLTVFAPGSISNLGPGFDCLGAALAGRGDRVHAWRRASGVVVENVSDPRIPLDPSRNTAALGAAALLRRAGAAIGISLAIEKGLPLSGGQGGSAASAVAGALAANLLLEQPLAPAEVMAAALEAEASVSGLHGDNVLPSLLGGAVLIVGLQPPRWARVAVHASLRLVLVAPDYGVETAAARAVLPQQVGRDAAVGQASRLGGLLLALERGDQELLGACLEDGIAEPHRIALYPGYPEAREAGLAAGAIGVVVSGAGPTALAFASQAVAPAVAAAMNAAYAARGIAARAQVTGVDVQGARREA